MQKNVTYTEKACFDPTTIVKYFAQDSNGGSSKAVSELKGDINMSNILPKRKNYFFTLFIIALTALFISLSFAVSYALSDHDTAESTPITYDENGDLTYESKMNLSQQAAHSLDKAFPFLATLGSLLTATWAFYHFVAHRDLERSFTPIQLSRDTVCLFWNDNFYTRKLHLAVVLDHTWVADNAKPGLILTGLAPDSQIALFEVDDEDGGKAHFVAAKDPC